MKIQELRTLINQNGGELKIGSIAMKTNGSDIDISIKGKLLAWIHQSEDEKATEDADMSIMSNFSIDTPEENKPEKEPNPEWAKPQSDQSQHALGMVEAYEKILLGRDLTISK